MNKEQSFSELAKGKIVTEIGRLDYEADDASTPIVFFMRVGPKRWLRFFFDAGVFFWKEVETPDPTRTENGHSYRFVPVRETAALLPDEITNTTFKGLEGAAVRGLLIEFMGGAKLRLVNAKDENVLIAE